MATLTNGLTPENYDLLRQQVGYRESRYNYNIAGGAGGNYLGINQQGAQSLETEGYLYSGSYKRYGNQAVWEPSNWTGKDGVYSANDFLNNPGAQENAFLGSTTTNFRTLNKIGLLDSSSSQEEIAGKLSASHIAGAGNLKQYGLGFADANGTTAGSYYSEAYNTIASGKFDPGKTVTSLVSAPGTIISNAAKSVTTIYQPKGFTSAIGNSVTIGLGSTGATPVEEVTGPIPNPLEKYASFTTLFTFSCLPKGHVNNPEKTYLKGDLGSIIFSSAGRTPDNRVSTAYVTSANKSGKYDYFIDNVSIAMKIVPTPDTKGAMASNIEFDVYEPYSLGMFLQSCQLAAANNSFRDYTQSSFLLTMEFMGYTSDGKVEKIPFTTRYFPLKLKEIAMQVKSSGSKYHVTAVPWTEVALENVHNQLKQNIAISGATVQEMLQSGENSLQYVVNSRFKEMSTEAANAFLPDEVVIVFPIIEQQGNTPSSTPSNSASDQDAGATTASRSTNSQSAGNSAVEAKLSLSRPGSLLVQSADTVSKLGKSSLQFNLSRAGQFPKVGDNDAVVAGSGGVVNRKMVEAKADKREFIFSQGTTIVNAINEVMLMSEYCTDAVTKNKPDEKTGMIDWFRIETQVYLLDPKPGNSGINTSPKLLVYRVVPYKVHMSKFQAPTVAPKGYEAMKKRAAKVYNYMYTGKNVDIIDFNIELKTAMYVAAYADGGKWNSEAVNESRNAQGGNEAAPVANNNTDGKSVDPGMGNKIIDASPTRYKNSDGSYNDTYKTLVAKQFQYALLESNKNDMVKLDLTIWGDPYFIADSGMGNYRDISHTPITPGGAINFQSGERDIVINFRSPIDIGSNGIMEFGKGDLDTPFSGLYEVLELSTSVSKGKFTQTLKLQRRPNQDPIPQLAAAPAAQGARTPENAATTPPDAGATVNPNAVPPSTRVSSADEGKTESLVTEKNNAAVNTTTAMGTQVA